MGAARPGHDLPVGLRRDDALTVTQAGRELTAVLRGELDMAATGGLRRCVDAAAGRRGLVIDLGATTFLDSSALKELLRANAELARQGTRLVLTGVPPTVRRLLELTGTTGLFAIAADRDAALRELAGG